MYIEKTADISNMYSHTAILKLFYNTVVAGIGFMWHTMKTKHYYLFLGDHENFTQPML